MKLPLRPTDKLTPVTRMAHQNNISCMYIHHSIPNVTVQYISESGSTDMAHQNKIPCLYIIHTLPNVTVQYISDCGSTSINRVTSMTVTPS